MRRYAAKVCFRFKTTYRNKVSPNVFYEIRILNVEARDDVSALRKVLRHCRKDQWKAAPAPDIRLQEQRFVEVLELIDVGVLEANEAYYEYVDEKPRRVRRDAGLLEDAERKLQVPRG